MPSAYCEAEIVRRIQRALENCATRKRSDLFVGIGDDAAVLRLGHNHFQVISTDAFSEGSHFLSPVHRPEDVGYKALARSVSDLAAVGAVPSFFLLNLSLPRKYAGEWLKRFLRGMASASRRFSIRLIGGDTTRPFKHPLFSANLTVLGVTAGYPPVLRSGARPGDSIYLTGKAGSAQVGLELVRRNFGKAKWSAKYMQRHLRPEPRLQFGEWLARQRLATAMIDTSDGLSSDLRNLCIASAVGARVDWDLLPKAPIPHQMKIGAQAAQKISLHGGDDYELLFTVPPNKTRKIPQRFNDFSVTCIGRITAGKRIVLAGKTSARPLFSMGWDPFCGK